MRPIGLLPFLFFVLLASCFVSPTASGQVSGLGSFYDFGDLSEEASVPGGMGHLSLDASFSGNHLIIVADISEGWHLYSVTQPDGGSIRSEIRLDPVAELEIVAIRPTEAPHIITDAPGFSVPLEEHEHVTWIVTFRNELPRDLVVTGSVYGQLCLSGEGGTCLPPENYPFRAKYDPQLDVDAFLEAAANLPETFVYHPASVAGDVGEGTELVGGFVPQEMTQVTSFATALFYAFLGGMILNFMPCVLPVIGLKIMSFFEQAGKSRARAFYLNAWYSLGLLSVFFFLAGLSYGLSILFTFDLFNIIMACVVFAMALSLMEVWELSVPGFLGTGTSGKLMQKEGPVGAFFKGIITTLLAIPCGAPLLSPAVNWADMQIRSGNTGLVFIAYGMIGLGMASPYLVVGAFPELLRFLPKPGEWMETFKKTMGFFLLIAVVWILYFVQLERLLPTVTLLFGLWFACWTIGRLGYTAKPRQRVIAWALSLSVLLLILLISFQIPGISNPYNLENAMRQRLARQTFRPPADGEHTHWAPYTPEVFEQAIRSGKPVLVDFTADWCATCKWLEATVLETEPILKKLDEKEAISLLADRTREGDAAVFLRKFGADQVPVLVIFDPKDPSKPTVLRGGYTQKTLLDILDGFTP